MVFTTGLYAQQKELLVPFSSPNEPKTLDIQLFHGDIKVMGTERADVLIKYIIEEKENDHPRHTDEKNQGMKKIGGGNFEFEIGERNNEVSVRSQNFMNMIRLEIEVPRDISINISKQLGENVWVEDISGAINIENNIGSVTLKKVRGIVNASSSAGEILVEFDEIDPDQSMTFNTVTGNIDLTIPSQHKANLKMRTQWGDIYSDLSVETKQEKANVTEKKDPSNGMTLVSNNWTHATLNGGGPLMTVKTQMGSIYLRSKN